MSALHYAARHNLLEVTKLLVEAGANVNLAAEEGLTPLHYAARFKICEQSSKRNQKLVSTYRSVEGTPADLTGAFQTCFIHPNVS